MFTGIIDNQAWVKGVKRSGGQLRLILKLKRLEKDLQIGESIAVDGVCLTLVSFHRAELEMDVIRETLQATTLGKLKPGDRVNIERSLRIGDRLGGHFVTGHVDARGRIEKISRHGKNRTYHFKAPSFLMKFLAPKGSVAVDGVSLTVQRVQGTAFEVGLIPATLRVTTLGLKQEGDEVNLEVDLIARYLERLVTIPFKKKKIKQHVTITKLRQQGF